MQDLAIARRIKDGEDDRLRAVVSASPLLSHVLDRWPVIDLPDVWLSGSAISQTVWNAAGARAPAYGIADVDLVYFDYNLGADCEQDHAERIAARFQDLPVRLDVKNQARVHLWYERKFGQSIRPYRSVREAIGTFPTTAAAVAIRPGREQIEIFAPFGLGDLLSLTVRPNKRQITRAIYEQKIERWRCFWPELAISSWDD
jgi:hypothetical protein